MTASERWTRLAPYAQQLLEDREVRDALRRAVGGAREAYGRAKSKGARQAVDDKKMWRRLKEAADATSDFFSAVSAPAPRKRHWGRTAVVVAVTGAGAMLALNADARATVAGLISKADESADSAPTPQSSSQ